MNTKNFITLHFNFLTQINVSCFLFILLICSQEMFMPAIFLRRRPVLKLQLFFYLPVKNALVKIRCKENVQYDNITMLNLIQEFN